VSQITFKKWFLKAPFLVPQRTFQNRVLPFLKDFLKEPIKMSQRTFNTWFFKATYLVPHEPVKPGFFKEPFP